MNEGLGSAATLAVKQRGGIQSIRKGEAPGHAAAKPREPSELAVSRAKSRRAARRGVARRRVDEEAPLDRRCAGSQRGGLFTEPSPTDLGVARRCGPLREGSLKLASGGWRDRRVRGSADGERTRRKKTPPRSSDEINRKPTARRSGSGVVKRWALRSSAYGRQLFQAGAIRETEHLARGRRDLVGSERGTGARS